MREEMGREILDAGRVARPSPSPTISSPMSMCAHRTASPRSPSCCAGSTAWSWCSTTEGKRVAGLDHPRSGELVAISKADRWFSYYFWLDDERAPDYARTVDIHRKPGYDPVELFVDPAIKLPLLAVGWRLAKRKLGQRTLLDVISLKDTQLVKGSHGRLTDDPQDGPLVISSRPDLLPEGSVAATDFKALVLRHVFG